MDLQAFLQEKKTKTEQALDAYLNAWKEAPPELLEAIRYSLFAGGKRMRPALALGTAEIISGDDAAGAPAACALEMIHTYSLIHDDLPAMDDDDLRRGQPTAHKKFGEATAILAGDALLTMAFHTLSKAGNLAVICEVAQAAGVSGMAGGQFIDLQSEGRSLTLEELQRIHAWKTGALFRVSARSGAQLAGATDQQLTAVTAYGEHLGLAFQITDDILNVVGDADLTGKAVGSDAAKEKSTYPALLGLDRSRQLADETVDAALDALSIFGPEADMLRELARYVATRDR